MERFTRIALDSIDELQLNAGVLLTSFNPNNPYVTPADGDILATTTGGINPVCEPQYSDFGEDVDNVPNNMLEFKHLDGFECSMAFTTIKFNAENTVWSIGAADTSTLGNGVTKIKPRNSLQSSDFKDLWWVGDKAGGGAFAVRLINALSTGGLNVQSTKNGKGTNETTITGHYSIYNQDEVPMEFYDIPAETAGSTYPVQQELTHVTSSFSAASITKNASLSATLSAESGYTLGDVSVYMGGVDVTALAYDAGAVSIAEVTAAVKIIAEATEE